MKTKKHNFDNFKFDEDSLLAANPFDPDFQNIPIPAIETNSLMQVQVLSGFQIVHDALRQLNLGEGIRELAELTGKERSEANQLFEIANISGIDSLQQYIENNPPSALTIAFLVLTVQSQMRSTNAKNAANARHENNGNRAKQDAIREVWASGKYQSRDVCAEQECAALDMSFSAARKALRNTPNPI